MSKLGKKARKFAKKNLQSVLKQRRKTKPTFKNRPSKNGKSKAQNNVEKPTGISNESNSKLQGVDSVSLDLMFSDNYKDQVLDASDSDGYLSEDSSCPRIMEAEIGNALKDEILSSTYSAQNKKIHADLALQKKKLDRIKKKDPEFCNFLNSCDDRAKTLLNEDAYSDDDDTSDQGEQGEYKLPTGETKLLTSGVITTWSKMIKEEHNQPALINLLNAYRTVCHYGTESVGHTIENSETFCNVLLFMLMNANDIFSGQLQIPSLNFKKEALQELKKNSKWKSVKPLVKSYVRSTLFLLNQVTDTEILALAMSRVRASLILFTVFPSLTQRLIKTAVHLWATGGGVLSLSSFQIIQDVTSVFSSVYFESCLSKTFVAFISLSQVTEVADVKHMQFLRDSIVELCSLDIQKSSIKAVASFSQLAKILKLAAETKKKEFVKKTCSWEYVNCIDLWVRFITANIREHDFPRLFYMSTQLINGLAHSFPGPRYFPLRVKCIEWLNNLSSSSGTYIPLSSLILDILEYKFAKEGRNSQDAFNFASVLKTPKHYLKVKKFHEESVQSALEQLALHFAQWSYHITFPDLATIPLLRLRKFHEISTTESLRRVVKRMIDQVEQNVEFVQKKRDDVSFSPHDHQSADSFLQLEKSSLNTPFTQYYRSVLEKAAERRMLMCRQKSLPKSRPLEGNGALVKRKTYSVSLNADADKTGAEKGFATTKRRKAVKVQ